jgi:hypothetical protein
MIQSLRRPLGLERHRARLTTAALAVLAVLLGVLLAAATSRPPAFLLSLAGTTAATPPPAAGGDASAKALLGRFTALDWQRALLTLRQSGDESPAGRLACTAQDFLGAEARYFELLKRRENLRAQGAEVAGRILERLPASVRRGAAP